MTRPRATTCPRNGWLLPLLLATLLFSWPAGGHVPVVPGGDHGAAGIVVPDPLKSWAFYGLIHEAGESDLYRFDLRSGDRLVVSLQVPDTAAPPLLVVMGPGLTPSGILPPGVEVPPGSSAVVLSGIPPTTATRYSPSPGASVSSFATG